MSFTHDTTHIYASGVETGDALRAYIVTNSLGTVIDRTIIFGRNLQASTDLEFTDDNYTYIFPDVYHLDFTVPPTSFYLESGTIVYTEGAKGATTQLYGTSVTLIDTVFRIEGGGARSDFTRSLATGWVMDNMQFINNATVGSPLNYLMLVFGGGTQTGVVIGGTGRTTLAVSSANGAETTCKKWKLDTSIARIAVTTDTGHVIFDELEWDSTSWNAGQANRPQQTFEILNPIKPDGWYRYVGGNAQEKHTHNVKVVQNDGSGVENYIVRLYEDDETTVTYDLLTDANGDIPEQEVITYSDDLVVGTFVQKSNFELRGIGYLNNLVSGTRALQEGRIDETVLAAIDTSITELDKAVTDTYTEQETPAKAYDALKAYLVNNFQGETEVLVSTDLGKTLIDAGSYEVTVDGGSGTPTLVGNVITIFTGGLPFVGDINSNITVIQNGASVKGLITDNNLDSMFFFTSITNWEIYPTVNDRTAKTNLIAQGNSDQVYHFLNTGLDYFFAVTTATGTEVNVSRVATDYITGKNEVSLDNTSLILGLVEGQNQMKENQDNINNGVQKSSLVIPHGTENPYPSDLDPNVS